MFVEENDGIPGYLCGEKEAITEHFFTCKPTSEIRRNWNVREEDLEVYRRSLQAKDEGMDR